MKRSSCKCKNNSIFNLDDCEPKEVSSVIKYLRLRKVFCDNCIFAKFHEGKIIQTYNKGIQISVPNIFKISLDIDLTTCFTSICITESFIRPLYLYKMNYFLFLQKIRMAFSNIWQFIINDKFYLNVFDTNRISYGVLTSFEIYPRVCKHRNSK